MRRALGWALVGLVAFALVASTLLFVWPPTGQAPGSAEAVVVLSGGRGDRLPKALAMMRRGVAPVLVISHGEDPSWKAARQVCERPQTFSVICSTPYPDTTQGEARMLRRLVAGHRWRRLAVVTSTYHVVRARVLLGRCIPGRFAMVASVPHDRVLTTALHVGHEWLGLGYAEVVRRGC